AGSGGRWGGARAVRGSRSRPRGDRAPTTIRWSPYPARPGASGALAFADALGGGARKLVHALVVHVAGVAAHPLPLHLVAGIRGRQTLPQVAVLHRIAGGGLPAATDPVRKPLADALLHVLGDGMQHDLAGRLQAFQAGDRRHQFHAVVGGVGFAADQFALGAAVTQQRRPAARPRIAEAGAVGMDLNLLHVPAAQPALMPGRRLTGAAALRKGVSAASRRRRTVKRPARKASARPRWRGS